MTKYCKDCIHFLKHVSNVPPQFAVDMCARSGITIESPVNGPRTIGMFSAHEERDDPPRWYLIIAKMFNPDAMRVRCGPEAKFFERKERD